MQYRIDPKSGKKLSALGFGCMRFPRGIAIDVQASEKLILQAIENGVNYFDTAYIYGGSEATLGEIAHKNKIRDKICIATKLPHHQCQSYDDFDRIFNIQKERLKTSFIDYYLVHNISDTKAWRRLLDLGVEKWINAKKSSGEIRSAGFSFHGAQAGFLELLDAYDWEFCQIQYNYMNENYQAGRAGLEKAYSKGLPVIVMEPLLGGKLASGLPKKAEKIFKEADPSRTPAAWALKWLWNHPEVTVVLSGMSSMEQLSDNTAASENSNAGSASKDELAVIESVKKVFEESYKVPCTGCNYCMPCPKNVNIPGCFTAYNTMFASGFVAGMTQYLTGANALHLTDSQRVSNCVKCGLCEKKCPQHIKIPTELEAVRKKMEPFWLNPLLKVVRSVIKVK